MNITDLIVEMLEKGQKVDLPGIGTLDSVMQNAHHDPKSQTYYPASRVIAYSESAEGGDDIIKELAARECIGEDVAKQMWTNYVDALTDKLKRTGKHTLGRLGTLTCDGKKSYGFTMTEGLVLSADESGEVPLTEVKTYSHDNEEDPFAQFDDEPEAKLVQPNEEPEPAPAPEPAPDPAPVAEPEPQAEPVKGSSIHESWHEELKQLDEIPQSDAQRQEDAKAAAKAEKERIKAEKKAEVERIKLEKKAEEERKRAEELLAKERAAEQKREEEERRKAEEALRKAEKAAEKERRKAEKTAEEALRKAEKEANKDRIKAEKKAAALAAIAARENAKLEAAARVEQEKENARIEKENARLEKERRKEAERAEKERRKAEKMAAKNAAKKTDNEEGEKKKRRVWPILLVLLALLLLGAGAYLLLHRTGGNDKPVMQAKHLTDVGATNSMTYNCDMIDYSDNEILRQRNMVCLFMDEYINTFLADRRYSNARVSMKDRVRTYADQRLTELLGPRFAAQRLLSYEDYVYAYNEPFMKGRYADSARCLVQGELMNYRFLDDMLYRMVDELGLQEDGQGTGKSAAEVQQVKDAERKALERRKAQQDGELPLYVYVQKGSKLGYDLIAGFYLNKNTAAKLTARLHEQGCDAYIIEFNDMYYVSMGSTSSQTAADALLKHVKSWYDGDVVIKKW